MAWSEHLGGNKYKIVERDPSKASRPKRSVTVYMPEEIARSKSEKKKEAWLALEEAKWSEQVIAGKVVKQEDITFKDFIPKWEKGYATGNMGEYTQNVNLYNLNKYVVPEFGHLKISKITTLQLVTFFGELKRENGEEFATNSKLNIYKAAKSVFDAAHDWELIAKNPMAGVKRPQTSKKEKKVMRGVKKAFNSSETETILLALYDLPDRWRLYFTGSLLGGFRRGEYLAVEWPDVDYDRGAIWIDKQITFDKDGKKIEGEVKTEESEGWVAMPKWYMAQLKEYERLWKKEKFQCKDWAGENKSYVFHGGKGVMYFPTTPTSTWRKFLQKKGIPHVKLHGLRHTAAMLLRESGADLKTMQERLRHTKIGTTADIYTHQSEMISRDAADRLEVFDPKKLRFAP